MIEKKILLTDVQVLYALELKTNKQKFSSVRPFVRL